ncbi:LacI family transcriptional regulator [Capsulimonas corticalis]|uniref:LacI family transcriptional regulator n=1 Tax=Capsulimonas corticalis TaxID=2219043 RepID=A0A402CYW5_9BACT|nr:LacI family DNA-binding transcriptional regulator [Capsulimonas corticalis]BDI29621.1 LacI family transcriptional regulator [Capsulimonas corticalis]
MRRNEAPTLTDVALRAGVNKITASVVLSGGRSNTRVSEATRERIIAAAAELRYEPSAIARSLRRRETQAIGFYMGGYIDTRSLFLADVVSGIQQACEQQRRDFLMHGTFRGDSTDEIYTELVNGKVDGLILHAFSDSALAPRLAASHLPVIAITDPIAGLPSICVDDVAGGRLQAEYLAQSGHRHVLYGVCPYRLSSTVRRYEAFCAAAYALGMTVTAGAARTNDDVVSGVERHYLEIAPGKRPTAAVCWNDVFAYQMIEHFRSAGVRVPEDLAVVGFDGSTSPIPPAYRLTTIRAPWRQMARDAVALVLSRHEGAAIPDETILPVEFIRGDTA